MALLAGFLPCASSIANRGAADLLEAQLFAYGVGSSIAVAEVGSSSSMELCRFVEIVQPSHLHVLGGAICFSLVV